MKKSLETILGESGAFKRYLGILDTYAVEWSIEKAARDTLQNFFDANNCSLDGIDIGIKKDGSEYIVRINGNAEYDYRHLLHLGGTTKTKNNLVAGGFGEGAKILALVLLRDYKFSQVRFASSGWMLDFLLEELADGEYVEKRKGLFAFLRNTKKISGNFVEFKTKAKEYAEAFLQAKDFFFHSENPDFKDPTLNTSFGGFKFLGGVKREGIRNESPKGNFYYAGQRRHYSMPYWNTVDFVNLWTYVKCELNNDRDRGLVSSYELNKEIIPQIVGSAKVYDLIKALFIMEPIWSEYTEFEFRAGPKILEAIVERLHKEKVQLKFEDRYLAKDLLMPKVIAVALASAGYVLCAPHFNKIGMKTAMQKFREMSEHIKIQPTSSEEKKINLLYKAASILGKQNKEIWLYSKTDENNIIAGQYNEKFVWLSREKLSQDFSAAFATYLHELDHEYGSDVSAEFSYALTNTLETVIESIYNNYKKFDDLIKEWKKTN